MNIKAIHKITLIILILFISGCAGYNRVLLATKTNVGIDIDTTPPTAEITIARREIAIQPILPDYPNPAPTMPSIPERVASTANGEKSEQEYALPLVAAFAKLGGFFNPEISGYFAGGDAAIHIVQENSEKSPTSNPEKSSSSNTGSSASTSNDSSSSLCLRNEPYDMRSPLEKFLDLIMFKDTEAAKKAARAESRPFYFATDTSTGLKVAWSGTGGPYPDSFKLGYNRKEFASPPVFVNHIKEGCQGDPDYQWQVKLPSFVATVNVAANIRIGNDDEKSKSGLSQVQFFATGKAATEFAKRSDVKELISKRIKQITLSDEQVTSSGKQAASSESNSTTTNSAK